MSVKTLVNDPDFEKLSPQDKKIALSSVDPDFSKLNDADLNTAVNGVRSADSQAQPKSLMQSVNQADPTQLIKQAAPSNLLKLAGVASANAPGMASAVMNSIPGMGNPSAIMPAIQNIRANPGQPLQAIKRMAAVQNGDGLTPEEKLPARIGQGAGTLMEMAVPSMGGAPLGENQAQLSGMKALGYTKRFLKNEKMLKDAKATSQVMLDQGVIKPFSSAEDIAGGVSDLADKSGKRIGEILDRVDSGMPSDPSGKLMALPNKTKGRFFDPKKAISDLEELRPVGDDGNVLRGGAYDQINSQIDDAVKTIAAHGNNGVTLKTANQIKGLLQSDVAWQGKRNAQNLMDRLIAGRFRESVDQQLDSAAKSIGDKSIAQDFAKNKALYAHAQRATDPIFNRVSSELGNKGISLTDWIAAAPELAAGNPATAVAILGGKRAFEKLGPQTTASLANKVAKMGIPSSPLNKLAASAPILSTSTKVLTDEAQAKKYLKQAKGDPDKARALAKADGYEIGQ